MEVIDSGIGITSDALSRIFDPFEQAGGSGFGGLGLGLSISKAIVELHGGKIFASSAGADHGARFVIELTNVVSCTIERPFPQTDPPIQKRVPNPRILLVDDHADSIRPMQLFLEASGYEVTTADTVATALRAATQNQFDLLVSDIGGARLRPSRVPASLAVRGRQEKQTDTVMFESSCRRVGVSACQRACEPANCAFENLSSSEVCVQRR